MRAFTNIELVTWPIECSALPGRAEIIRATCTAHKAKLRLRQTTCGNGYLMLKGEISVREHSYVASRAKMHAVLDAIASAGIDRATLSNRF